MPPKRKRNQGDVDDDDVPALGNRVLPVADLPSDFSGEPEDGAQYLFLVRYAQVKPAVRLTFY